MPIISLFTLPQETGGQVGKVFFVAAELNAGRTFCLANIGALLKEVIGIILRNEDVELYTDIVDLLLALNTHGLHSLISQRSQKKEYR